MIVIRITLIRMTTSGLYYKTITIIIMTIVSDATIWSVSYDRNLQRQLRLGSSITIISRVFIIQANVITIVKSTIVNVYSTGHRSVRTICRMPLSRMPLRRMILITMTFSRKTLGRKTLSRMSFIRMTLSRTALSRMIFN